MADQPKIPASDPDAWLAQYGDILYRYAYFHVRDSGSAEDLVQETLLAAFSARARFAGLSSERTWLIGILKNKLIDHLRRRAREQPLPEETDEDEALEALFSPEGHWLRLPAAWENPFTALEQKQFWQVFIRCLAALPAAQAQAFRLREVDGVDSEIVCKVLGVSTTNLWVLLHRSRLRLRQCLEKQWFTGG